MHKATYVAEFQRPFTGIDSCRISIIPPAIKIGIFATKLNNVHKHKLALA